MDHKNKILIRTVIGIVLLAGLILLTQVKLPSKSQNTEQKPSGDVVSYRTTLTGEYTCLPHKNTSGPQTLECALGMKTDSGEYYALDFNLSSGPMPILATGERFTASGVLTPIEMLNSTHLRDTYQVKGVFSVTDSFKKE